MIKGVNRQMIEVTDTGNPYFERALLVVRAECMEQPEVRLHEEAHKILASSDAYSGLRLSRRTRRIRRILFGACSGGAGLAFGMLLQGLVFRSKAAGSNPRRSRTVEKVEKAHSMAQTATVSSGSVFSRTGASKTLLICDKGRKHGVVPPFAKSRGEPGGDRGNKVSDSKPP